MIGIKKVNIEKSMLKPIISYTEMVDIIIYVVLKLLYSSYDYDNGEDFKTKISFIPDDKKHEFLWNEILSIQNHLINDFPIGLKETNI